jgi:proline dehydrogenase
MRRVAALAARQRGAAAAPSATVLSTCPAGPGISEAPWLMRSHAATPTVRVVPGERDRGQFANHSSLALSPLSHSPPSFPNAQPPARGDAATVAEPAAVDRAAPATTAPPSPPSTSALPDFARPTFAAAPTADLLRSWAVLAACTAGSGPGRPGLAAHAETLLARASALVGARTVDAAVRATFFRVFCAGEGLGAAVERARTLRAARIRGILNYAAEGETTSTATAGLAHGSPDGAAGPDAAFDERAATFLEAVAATDTSPLPGEEAHGGGVGVTALKVSALGPADVLERASAALVDGGGGVDRWAGLPPATTGGLPALRARLASAGLSPADLAAWDGLVSRTAAIADACAAHAAATGGGMRLIIDAEQTWVQPAVDALAIGLMAAHNTHANARFTVLNTYQHYLTHTPARLAVDAARAEREGWVLGAKPVRGAYLMAERARAAASGASDPIQPTIEATHAAYDDALTARLVPGAAAGTISLLVATHNQASVETAVRAMDRAGLPPSTPHVAFGQLCGMRDFLTYTLAGGGYRTYKILPYGNHLRETLLYLSRRAAENCDVLGNAGVDLRMLRGELRARARLAVGLAG